MGIVLRFFLHIQGFWDKKMFNTNHLPIFYKLAFITLSLKKSEANILIKNFKKFKKNIC